MQNDQKQHEKLMHMPPLKALIILGIPSILMQLVDELNSMIDAVFMGQFFGSEAVASMSVVFPYLLLIVAIGTIFSAGTNVAVGRYLGAKDIKSANRVFMTSGFISVLLGIVIGIVGYLAIPSILNLFQLSATTQYYAAVYMKAISLGLPIIMLATLLNGIIYTEGHAKISLGFSIFQLVFNALMNFVLLYILRLGVISIVSATLLSMCLQIGVMLLYIQSNKMSLRIDFSAIKPSANYFKEVMPLGMPTFVTMILLSVTLGFESNIISSFGADALSVQTITGYLFSATGSVATGIMSAAMVLMSYTVGAKQMHQFKKLLNISLITVFVSSVVLNLPLIFNSTLVAAMFTNSATVAALIKIPAYAYGLSAPFIFTTNVYLYSMIPVGMENLSTGIFALQQIVLFVPLLLILKPFGFLVAIAAQPIAEVIGGIVTVGLIPYFNRRLERVFVWL